MSNAAALVQVREILLFISGLAPLPASVREPLEADALRYLREEVAPRLNARDREHAAELAKVESIFEEHRRRVRRDPHTTWRLIQEAPIPGQPERLPAGFQRVTYP